MASGAAVLKTVRIDQSQNSSVGDQGTKVSGSGLFALFELAQFLLIVHVVDELVRHEESKSYSVGCTNMAL